MPKTKISEFSATPANNTDIDSINISEGCAPSGINDAIRELMAQLKDFQTGAVGDSFNGPVGTTTAAAGAFTTLSATGNVTLGDASTDTLNVGNGGLIKDASGNLGLGVTPSAWSGYKVLQAGIASFAGGSSGAYLIQDNAYTDNSGAGWKYINSSYAAAQYYAASGAHVWRTAPSGTAGNAITFTQAMTLDASGNLLLGTTSSSYTGANRVAVVANGATQALFGLATGGTSKGYLYSDATNILLYSESATGYMGFGTNNTERARIDSSGNLLVGTTSAGGQGGLTVYPNGSGTSVQLSFKKAADGIQNTVQVFFAGSTQVGSVTYTNTATAFNTSSDYRLKNTIAPMTGALAKVAQLKPVTYKWNADGSDGEGFIAHELAEVFPNAVTGEKDAVREDGSIKPQGIDTSFLVATLTAALQELKAEFDAYKASHP